MDPRSSYPSHQLSLHKAAEPDLLKQLRPPCLRAILIGVLIRRHVVLSSRNGVRLILGGPYVMPLANTRILDLHRRGATPATIGRALRFASFFLWWTRELV